MTRGHHPIPWRCRKPGRPPPVREDARRGYVTCRNTGAGAEGTMGGPGQGGGGGSPGLPGRLAGVSVPSAVLRLPPCAHQVGNGQGKRWRQGPPPWTSKKMYWAGCFQQAKVSFQCTLSGCLLPPKIICRSVNLRGFFTLPYARGSRGDDRNGASAHLASH